MKNKIREITSLLVKECNLLRSTQSPLKKTATNKCAVIVEPRKHELLEPIIRNLFDKIEGWNLHIFCGTENHDFVKDLLPDWEYKITNTGFANLKDGIDGNEDSYNHLLVQPSFWEEIEEENILIFQVDCLFLNGFDVERFMEEGYGFIGSPYNFGDRAPDGSLIEDLVCPPDRGFNLNGGLSLRKRSLMLKSLDDGGYDGMVAKLAVFRKEHGLNVSAFTSEVLGVAEDVFFNNALAYMEEKLPDLKTAQEFSFQHEYSDLWQSSLAIHNWDKDYACQDSSARFFLDRHQFSKPKLCIYTGYSSAAYNGSNYSGKPDVRGSEIAFINIAEQLTSKYDVYISGPSIEEGVYNNVKYFNSSKLQWFLEHTEIEIMIVNRYIHFFVEFSNTAKKTYIWLHDMCYQNFWRGEEFPDAGKHLINNVYDDIDGFVCLSDWHVGNIMSLYDLPEDKIFKIGNGIEPNMFIKHIKKQKNKFIYSSLPERGLSILVDWMPDIIQKLPDAELHVFTDHTPDDLVRRMSETEGVFFHGKVPYERMIDEFMSSDVWLYPNIFLETFCTSALEAQASKCVCVTRNFGSLGEVVGDRGIVVTGDPASEEFKNETIKKLINTLENKEVKENLQNKAQGWALQKSWANRALEWIKMFEK